MEKRTVLFVDDEEKVLASLKRSLIGEPYETIFAASGKEALDILKQRVAHVIVTDMRMPEMSGLELLKIIKGEYPYAVKVVLSGHTDISSVLASINEGEIFQFIIKPWKIDEELKTVVRQSIEHYNLHSEREMLLNVLEQLLDGVEKKELNLQFIQTLISTRKRRLNEWYKESESALPGSQ